MELKNICSYSCDKVETSLFKLEDYISTENMLPNKGGIILASSIPSGKATHFCENDILISNIRPYFKKIWKSDKEGICSGDVLCIKASGNTDPLYLYYLLSQDSFFDYVMAGSKGTKMPRGDKDQIMRYEVEVSPLPTQRRIAAILSSLDRKIELNNKINAELEEMAQAIFKDWFVDFTPFRDGKFVESELGMIPEGFKIVQIADLPHIIETGRRPKGGVGEILQGIPSIGAEHVKGLGSYDYSKTKYIPIEYASTLKTGWISGYELLIYKDGGKPGFFIPNYSIFGEGYPFETCALNEHVFKLDFNGNQGFNAFCYFYFKNEYVMNYLNAQGGKAAIPGINRKDIESLYIISPDNPKVSEYGTFVLPLIKTILRNLKQNRELSQLRDTLLPKLMSGEIEL